MITRSAVENGGYSISALSRFLCDKPVSRAANDNHLLTAKPVPSEKMLNAALRHFGEHGLGAARSARANAEQAFFAGDRQAYDWWLGITRTLDHRLAREAERGIHSA